MTKTNPKKIIFVYDAIFPYVKGGAERRFYELGKRLVKMGYEVHWYGMKYWDGPKVLEPEGIYIHGICKARPLYTTSGRRSISQALVFGLSCFKLIGINFDVIDCCGFPYFSLFPAKLAALIKRKPLFATWHEVCGKKYWYEYLGSLGFIGYVVEKMASKLPNQIIATSQHTADLLSQDLGVKHSISVIPNGIDMKLISNLSADKSKSDVIYVGRLMDFKNIDLIIQAVSKLNTQGTKVRCTVIGDGPEKNSLQKLSKKLGTEDQITWYGFIEKNEDVYAHVKSSKVLVLPSEREGFGIVAIEANACGIPVLTLDHQGNAARQLIKVNKNGMLFQKNADNLAEVIKHVLDSGQVTWHKESQIIARDFDWGLLTNKLVNEYVL